MNSKKWRELRARKLTANPLCEECKRKGIITAARCVHHLTPVESGRTDRDCEDLAYG